MKGFILSIAIFCCTLPIISPVHSGGTDGAGGHYNHSTGEYHYHHGYSAHQHYNGECPYDVQEEEYDCGREDCDIPGQHYHSNKATTTTTTTTTTRTTQKQQNSKNDSVPKDSSDTLLIGLCFCLLVVGIVIYGNSDKIKAFISKRRKKGNR